MAENVEQIAPVLQVYTWITVTDTVEKLDISFGSAYSIIQEDLKASQNLCKVGAKFTDKHKRECVEMCM
jgi:hypothetical protein